jgi:hypothetical protein
MGGIRIMYKPRYRYNWATNTWDNISVLNFFPSSRREKAKIRQREYNLYLSRLIEAAQLQKLPAF